MNNKVKITSLITRIMPKNTTRNTSKEVKSKSKNNSVQKQSPVSSGPVNLDGKNNNILISVTAKPGAKQNSITDILPEGVAIQINAPASEGEANAELVKYMVSVLGLKKSEVTLDKGFKSRSKVLRVDANTTIEEVLGRIETEMKS